MMKTTNEYPDPNDRSKHDPDVRSQLFLLQFSHRLTNQLCIFCGEVKVPLEKGACDPCLEKQKQKRIAEAGYDYYANLDGEE